LVWLENKGRVKSSKHQSITSTSKQNNCCF